MSSLTHLGVSAAALALGIFLSILAVLFAGHKSRLAGCLPFVALLSFIGVADEGWTLQRFGWGIVLAVVWASWLILLAAIPVAALGAVSKRTVPFRWLVLVVWSAPICLLWSSSYTEHGAAPWILRAYVQTAWDPPLLAVARVARYCDHRLIGPFHSDIDDTITVGSFPMAQDVAFMKSHGITGVVNMCIEWPGPREEYGEVGITQLHLPTVDTTPPSLADLERGIAFIVAQKALGGRVFIHCKGGRGRAAAMALAWYVAQGLSPETGMSLLKSKRSVVSNKPVSYAAIQALSAKYSKEEL